MHWYVYAEYFAGGAFFANCIPHLVNGISGRPFQTPFADPPGKGLSSSLVNVLWGLFNLAVVYLLVVRQGDFDLHKLADACSLGGGMAMASILLARGFGKLHGGSTLRGTSS